MTTQEAIKELQVMRDAIERGEWICSNDNEALDMAIEALEVGHAQCNDCHYRYHWMTQRMNGQNGGSTA